MKLNKLLEGADLSKDEVEKRLNALGEKNGVDVISSYLSEVGLTYDHDFIGNAKSRCGPSGVSGMYDGENAWAESVTVENDGSITITFSMDGVHRDEDYDDDDDDEDDDEDSHSDSHDDEDLDFSFDETVQKRNVPMFLELIEKFDADGEDVDENLARKYVKVFNDSFGVDW